MVRRSLIAFALLAAPLGGIDAAELPKDLVEPGSLTYGVAATFAPFEFRKDGALAGFDIDFIDAISKKMKASPKPMNMEFKGLIPALQGNRIDVINSGMYINEARSQQVDFVPYLKIGSVVVVQASNPSKITGRDDSLCGRTVAVTLGGFQEGLARAEDARCRDKGLGKLTVLTLPTAQDSALTLRQGRADAYIDSTAGAAKIIQEVPDTFKIAGEAFDSNTQLGLAVRKGDRTLQESLKAAIHEVVVDGAYTAMIRKWGLPTSASIFN